MLDIKKVETNTTEAKASFSYADVVETLGMRVALEAGLSSTAPGTSLKLDWQETERDGSPGGVLVHVVIDHNYVAPAAASAAAPAPASSPSSVPVPPNSLASTIGALSGTPTSGQAGA